MERRRTSAGCQPGWTTWSATGSPRTWPASSAVTTCASSAPASPTGRWSRPRSTGSGACCAEEMADGALGVGTALIYPPGTFAGTPTNSSPSARSSAEHDGMYISHLRSEADQLLESVDELVEIGRRAQVRAEVYHLKAAGRPYWPKMPLAIERIERARSSGQPVTANMYPYTAGGTSLASCIPPRYHVGGAGGVRGPARRPGPAGPDGGRRCGPGPTAWRTSTSPPAAATACCCSPTSPTAPPPAAAGCPRWPPTSVWTRWTRCWRSSPATPRSAPHTSSSTEDNIRLGLRPALGLDRLGRARRTGPSRRGPTP